MTEIRDLAEEAVRLARNRGAIYADIRVDKARSTQIRYTHDAFDEANFGMMQGFGLRVLVEKAWGFACAAGLDKNAINSAVEDAYRGARAASVRLKEKVRLAEDKAHSEEVDLPVRGGLGEVPMSSKMKLCETLVKEAQAYDRRIVSARGLYLDSYGARAIANSEGTSVEIGHSRFYCSVKAIARRGEKNVSAIESQGLMGGAEKFRVTNHLELAHVAARRAKRLLTGRRAPVHRGPVILDPELTGVFIHEAVGHAAEGDYVLDGESILDGRIGKKVGPSSLTVHDDSSPSEGWGGSKYDDEGTRTTRRTIVKGGVLKGYLLNKESAHKLGMLANGGARAESFSSVPLVRMSNTSISSGDLSLEELMEDIRFGVLLAGTRGGEVDTSKGTFHFSSEDSQLIEKGEMTVNLLGGSFSGSTLDALKSIEAFGSDISQLSVFCDKKGQRVPVGIAGPYMRLKVAMVGE